MYFWKESLSLQEVRYAKIIRDAAHKISKTMGGSPITGGMYTCLQLKSSGITEDLAPFEKHPVNDRLIYGPLEGVKVWATMLRVVEEATP
jgi:hypothetical protein